MAKRPANFVHWTAVEGAEEAKHPATGEIRAFAADLGGAAGLTRLGIHHHRLLPGRRSAPPHAERDEEELVFVLEGTPDLWQDGYLHRLKPGVAVFWPDATGIAHCLINNSDAPARFLSIGEASRYRSRIAFPHDLKIAEWFAARGKLWADPPRRRLGPHDGLPDSGRGVPAPRKAYRPLPTNAVDWHGIEPLRGPTYTGDSEKMSDFATFNRISGLGRIGGGVDLLDPGRRTSYPHAERDEEEFTFVVDGTPDVWIDGHLHRLTAGDFVGWPSGSGQAHTIMNNTDRRALLLTMGEASRQRARVWYPFHAKRMKALKERAWMPERPPRLGPHNGKPGSGTLRVGRRS